MEMEMEEINFDEIFFDMMNPNLPHETDYSSISHPILSNCDHANQKIMSTTSITNNRRTNNKYDFVSTNSDHTQSKDEITHEDYCSLSSQIINFSTDKDDDCNIAANNGTLSLSQKRVITATSRTTPQARDHLMAERKRRENLRHLFIDLTKVVPGIKKVDKASLLEDAINYLKVLQERVNILEEEISKKQSILSGASKDDFYESTINNTENTGCCTISESSCAAKIKVRILERHVLIKIHCKKQMGLMSKVPWQMEKMHVSVLDMRILTFGEEALDITILAEIHSEFQGTVKDIVDHLQIIFYNPQEQSTTRQPD